jgi:hypothetical protein
MKHASLSLLEEASLAEFSLLERALAFMKGALVIHSLTTEVDVSCRNV